MKIRTLALPALLAATLALGVTGTARADSGHLSIQYDNGYDDHPRYSNNHGYYNKHRDRHHDRHYRHGRKHARKHLKRHHKAHGHGHGYGHRDEHSRYNRHHTGSHHDRNRHNTRSRIGIGYTGRL